MIEWHYIQKPLIFGILCRWNLCLTNNLKLFWPHIPSTVSDVQTCQLFGGKKIVDVHNVELFSDFFSCFFEIFFDAFFVLTLNYRQRTMIQFFHNFYNPEIYHFRTVCNVGENRMMTPNALFVEQTGSFFVPSAHC